VCIGARAGRLMNEGSRVIVSAGEAEKEVRCGHAIARTQRLWNVFSRSVRVRVLIRVITGKLLLSGPSVSESELLSMVS
jgi:hypothetical protein